MRCLASATVCLSACVPNGEPDEPDEPDEPEGLEVSLQRLADDGPVLTRCTPYGSTYLGVTTWSFTHTQGPSQSLLLFTLAALYSSETAWVRAASFDGVALEPLHQDARVSTPGVVFSLHRLDDPGLRVAKQVRLEYSRPVRDAVAWACEVSGYDPRVPVRAQAGSCAWSAEYRVGLTVGEPPSLVVAVFSHDNALTNVNMVADPPLVGPLYVEAENTMAGTLSSARTDSGGDKTFTGRASASHYACAFVVELRPNASGGPDPRGGGAVSGAGDEADQPAEESSALRRPLHGWSCQVAREELGAGGALLLVLSALLSRSRSRPSRG